MILVAEKDSQILEMVKSDIRSSLACLQSTELRMLNEHTSHLFFFLKFSLTSHLLGQEVLKVYKNTLTYIFMICKKFFCLHVDLDFQLKVSIYLVPAN